MKMKASERKHQRRRGIKKEAEEALKRRHQRGDQTGGFKEEASQ